MKALSMIFAASVVGVLLCLVMTGVTYVREREAASAPQPRTLPLPATAS
jgi:hypothetical protein